MYEMMFKGGPKHECIDHVTDKCFQFGYSYPDAKARKMMNGGLRKKMSGWVL